MLINDVMRLVIVCPPVTCLYCRREQEDHVTCLQQYKPFLKAVSKNYPAAATLNPAYAAQLFLTVLQPGQIIDFPAARSMHENFPELHSIKQVCLWRSIPDSWIPFLGQLAQRAAHIQDAPEVNCPYAVRMW